MRVRLLQYLFLAGCLLFSGCANLTSIAPGTTAASVESSRGKPFRVWPEKGGGASWEYPYGPSGRYTYMVRVGADGRVTAVDQVLGWNTFALLTKGMPAEEVEHLLGRPYSKVPLPLLNTTVWSWRFVETVWYRCFLAYIGPDGTLTGTGSKDEESGDTGIMTSDPC